MRELQFKAYHKATKEICDVGFIDLVNREVSVLPESELEGGNCVGWSFDDIELIEYIGLNYANGKPIFTGDITYHKGHNTNCEIRWSDKYGCFVGVDVEDFDTEYFYQRLDEPQLTKCGNIYTKPLKK